MGQSPDVPLTAEIARNACERTGGTAVLEGSIARFYGALYPIYVRGEAYVAGRNGVEGAKEFQKVLDHRGIVSADLIGVLAHLQLGRALALAGDKPSAKAMRHILLDRARRHVAAKRGGQVPKINLEQLPDFGSERSRELIALDDALNTLASVDDRKARVIELRFFGGLSVEETARVLNVSADTVLRDGRLARAWLLAELRNEQKT